MDEVISANDIVADVQGEVTVSKYFSPPAEIDNAKELRDPDMGALVSPQQQPYSGSVFNMIPYIEAENDLVAGISFVLINVPDVST